MSKCEHIGLFDSYPIGNRNFQKDVRKSHENWRNVTQFFFSHSFTLKAYIRKKDFKKIRKENNQWRVVKAFSRSQNFITSHNIESPSVNVTQIC